MSKKQQAIKQEKIEQAAYKIINDIGWDWFETERSARTVAEHCAKMQIEQAEKMYSEEDMRKAYFSGISSTGEGWNGEYADGNDPNIEEKFSEGFTQWFKQFKKK